MTYRCSFLVSSLALVLAACGGPGSGGDDPNHPDARVTSDGAHPQTLDPALCTAFASNAVSAAQTCGTPLPGNAQAQFETMCKKGIMAASTCGGNPAAGLDCFKTKEATDWMCFLGQPYPVCNGDTAAALGMYCLVALGNPQCASGIACQYDADCPNGSACNEATDQCFSQSAYCVGLPCVYDADCPTNEKCNGAEGACIAE